MFFYCRNGCKVPITDEPFAKGLSYQLAGCYYPRGGGGPHKADGSFDEEAWQKFNQELRAPVLDNAICPHCGTKGVMTVYERHGGDDATIGDRPGPESDGGGASAPVAAGGGGGAVCGAPDGEVE